MGLTFLIIACAAVLLVVIVPLNWVIDKLCPILALEGGEEDTRNESEEKPASEKCC
jgi:hypothetical protein